MAGAICGAVLLSSKGVGPVRADLRAGRYIESGFVRQGAIFGGQLGDLTLPRLRLACPSTSWSFSAPPEIALDFD
jgi:hypothetical protein